MSQHLGKYIIDSLIAEGGMAKIYRARTEGVGGIDKIVALKCMRNSMQENDEFVQMLLDEARITVRMTHKNIAQVYGLEHDGGTYFLAMEFIDGINLATLAQWVAQNRNGFPVEAVVFIIMEAAAGLSYAHRLTDDAGNPLGIVHRDVNPQNICISREGEVKLIDFGIAKSRQAYQQTVVGTIKGKFNYMSPEQARGNAVDQRTDIFALGAVMYELLCGKMLYPLTLDDATLRTKVRMADYEPIQTYMPNIPPILHKILDKALARDMTQRFATARDFLLALSQFFHDSCKVYDAISLSALAGHCIQDRVSGGQDTAGEVQKVIAPPPSGELNVLCMNDKTLDASVSALRSAVRNDSDQTLQDMELYAMIEEAPTALYSQNGFLEYQRQQEAAQKCRPDVSEIDRAVDLEMSGSSRDETVMLKLGSGVHGNDRNSRMAFGTRIRNALKGMMHKMLQLSEKSLLGIIALLVLFLVIIIVVVVAVVFRAGDAGETNRVTEETQVSILTMRVESQPTQAKIYLDGVDSGYKTPHDIPMNVSNVVLRLPYYQDKVVDFRDAHDAVVVVKMVPRRAKLEVDSNPSKAYVYINDVRQESQTPMYADVPIDRPLEIKVELDGYHRERRTVEWDDENEEKKTLTVELKPDRSGI